MRFLLASLLGLAVANFMSGQTPVAEQPAAGDPAAPAASPEKASDTLSVEFPDEEVKTVLRNVADLYDLNIVMPEGLSGRISIKLREVTWRQIFEVVLAPMNYTYVEEGNIVKVMSADALNQEPVTTEMFVISNAKALDVKPIIEGLVDAQAGGKILADARSNTVIVTERPSRMQRVRTVIERLDKATEQVMIESRFVEVTDRDIRDLGVNWTSLASYQVGAQPTDLAVVHNARNAGGGTGVPRNAEGILLSQLTDASTTFSAVFSAPEFNTVLSALSQKNNTKVVSSPTIVTLNNTEAVLNIGQEFPIPSYTYNSERGTFEVSGFEYKPIGIILRVTPQVNNEGTIRLMLEPEVSQENGQTSFGGAGGASIPIIATRKVKTQVSLRDGYTAGIGGLIQTNQAARNSKVPVLGSIPGLGRLFTSKGNTDTATNLLIFITAKTVSPEGAQPGKVFNSISLDAVGVDGDGNPIAAPAKK